MYNQVTDHFRLVQTEIVTTVPVLGRMIFAAEGYSLEIFRGEMHLGSVRTRQTMSAGGAEGGLVKMKVNNGDVIYKVRIVPLFVPVIGNLTTKDKYVRSYDLTLDLVVSDPVLFVQGYRLGRDPLHLSIERFKSSFQHYASQIKYEKLVGFKQPQDAWNNSLSAYTGLMVTQVSRWNFQSDPRHEAALTMQQEAEKKRKSIETDAEIQKLEDRLKRERNEAQKAYEREEDTRQRMHQLHWQLREIAAQELSDILRERIRYAFEAGTSVDAVAEDSLKLLNAFHESLHRGFIESTLASGSSTSTNGTSPEAGKTARGDSETDPLFHTQPNLADLSSIRGKEAGKE